MRIPAALALCSAATLFICQPARAYLIAGDSFLIGGTGNYTAGDITPQNPTSSFGFSGAWADGTTATSTYVASATALDATVPTYEVGGSGGYSSTGDFVRRVFRPLAAYTAPAAGTPTYWMSGLIRRTGGADNGAGQFTVVGFVGHAAALTDDNFVDSAVDHTIQGLQWGFVGDGANNDLVLRHRQQRAGSILQFTDIILDNAAINTTYHVILKLEKDVVVGDPQNNNDRVSVWLNPADISSELGLGSPTLQVNNFSLAQDTAIDRLTMATNLLANPTLFDELRFGTTLTDVTTAIPEPSSLVLVGAGMLALLARRRR